MVLRGELDGRPITLSLKRSALTVALDETTVAVLDRAGRLWSIYTQGHHFRRGLNGNVLAKWTDDGERQHRRLARSAADLVVRRASLIAQRLLERLIFKANPKIARQVTEVLTRAAAFDVAASRADVARYHQVYKPIGILPPDQYLALVLQVTEGCSFNTCTFCSFYKDRSFRIKSPGELRAHVAAVRAYLGDSILMRQGVFVADANALVVPQKQLVELLDVVLEELGTGRGLYAFLDGFSGQKKSADDYATLAERGLRRIYIGLESGHDPLLAWLRKPGRAADAVAAVRQIKSGGVNVGVIVLLGVGGRRYAEAHVRDTVEVLNRLHLDRGDLLYFSRFFPHGTPYETQVQAPDLLPLSPAQMQAQREAIVAGLRLSDPAPQIATYDIREFVY